MSSRARRIVTSFDVQPYQWASLEQLATITKTAGQRSAGEQGGEPRDLDAIERDAFAKGYAQGERAGAQAATTRAEAMIRRLGQTLEELAELRADMIRRTELQMVQLSLAIATRILKREIQFDRGLLAGMARVALDRLGANVSATIRLNPEDHAAVAASQSGPWESEQVKIIPDAQVSRGGCLVQSDFGFMDATPESQIQELARTLFEDAERAQPSEVHAVIAQ